MLLISRFGCSEMLNKNNKTSKMRFILLMAFTQNHTKNKNKEKCFAVSILCDEL